ncbi:MAG: DUF371 domain-containing protein [archaeon]
MDLFFTCRGHPNILASHANTLEFTKDQEVTPQGDCIVGAGADYDLEILKEFASRGGRAKVTMSVDDEVFVVEFERNPRFEDKDEIVIRLSDFLSTRTLGIRADHGARDIPQVMREKLQDPSKTIEVRFSDA